MGAVSAPERNGIHDTLVTNNVTIIAADTTNRLEIKFSRRNREQIVTDVAARVVDDRIPDQTAVVGIGGGWGGEVSEYGGGVVASSSCVTPRVWSSREKIDARATAHR